MKKLLSLSILTLLSAQASFAGGLKIADCTSEDGQFNVTVTDMDPSSTDGGLRYYLELRKTGSPEALVRGSSVFTLNSETEIYQITYNVPSSTDGVTLKRHSDRDGYSSLTATYGKTPQDLNVYVKCSTFYKKVKLGNFWLHAEP